MNAIELKKGIYWVGAIDWSVRSFHGYTTDRGTTYNAYLIIDEKIALIDTVKEAFSEELIERVSQIVSLDKIDYLISNHVEMDHSGAIPKIMELAANATIVTSAPQGVKGLTAHYGEYPYHGIKQGETISLGSRTLQFVATPMLHWPDNMVTYCKEEKILFSNDAFGQHYASAERFDDNNPLDSVVEQAKKYYANIVMPFSSQVKSAYDIVSKLDIDIIAPSHGIIWRNNVNLILEYYKKWSMNEPDERAVVVFDSMWHSTEKIAKAIVEAFVSKDIPVKFMDLKENDISDIMTDVLESKYICVGSSTLNNNMLPNVSAFLTYLKGLSPKNRKVLAFGSYGWGGQSIAHVEEQLLSCGFEIFSERIRIPYIPSKAQLEQIKETLIKDLSNV